MIIYLYKIYAHIYYALCAFSFFEYFFYITQHVKLAMEFYPEFRRDL